MPGLGLATAPLHLDNQGMAQPSNRLEKDFLAAANEFARRQLWRRFANDALFLIRVPTEEEPLVASIMGAAGQEFGLGLARGEGGFGGYVNLLHGPSSDQSFATTGDLLSVTFERWSEVPEVFRQVTLRAGPQPRRDKVVPFTFVSPPFESTRPAHRGELRSLLWVLRGILGADDAGAFEPFGLDEAGQRIFELRVDGEIKRPEVTTEVVPWPDRTVDAPLLSMLPADLASLPRHGERWLVGGVHLPALLEGDERLTTCCLVGIESGPLLGTEICQGDELAPAVNLLVRAFRGECPDSVQDGLPREIVFGDRRLYDTLAPALAGLDVPTRLDLDNAELALIAEGLRGAMDGFLEEHEPGSLGDWQQKSFEIGARLMVQVEDEQLLTPRAVKRYFGDAEQGEELLEELEGMGLVLALGEWLIADYRAPQRSKTLVEKHLARKGLAPEERTLLQARADATLSIYRVDGTRPGKSLEVECLLSGKRFTIHDPQLSELEAPGFFLPLRLMHVEGWVLPLPAGPPLASFQVEAALDQLERAGAELTPEGLRRDSEAFGRLWGWWQHLKPPRLQNTDGDALVLQDACFRVGDGIALGRELASREDLEYDDAEGAWIWSRPATIGGPEARTIRGHLTLLDDRLLLEVNSRERLEEARTWLEAIPGVSLESFTARDVQENELPLDDRLPSTPEPALGPEDVEHLRGLMLDHYRRWVDESVPILGGLTPREACATPEGRRKVERLVRTMPGMGTPGGVIEPPREEILRELGILGGEG
jgi:hypothetical protein